MVDEELREEQATELESVEAIFGEDFRLLEAADEATGTGARFRVDICAESADGAEQGPSSHPARVRLEFTHTTQYPREPISVLVNLLDGLVASDRKRLQSVVDSVAEESKDIVSVFAICDAARDWLCDEASGATTALETNRAPGALSHNNDLESRFETVDFLATEKVEVISSKAIGTPVTKESFEEWRIAFLAELENIRLNDGTRNDKDSSKMTGREFFESRTVVVTAEGESFWEAEASLS